MATFKNLPGRTLEKMSESFPTEEEVVDRDLRDRALLDLFNSLYDEEDGWAFLLELTIREFEEDCDELFQSDGVMQCIPLIMTDE